MLSPHYVGIRARQGLAGKCMTTKESQATAKAHTMPPKSMTPDAIKKMMEELLKEKLKEFKKGSSEKDKENEMEEDANGDEEGE